MLEPIIKPSPLIASNPTLVVERYSCLGWKDKISSLENLFIKSFVSILLVARFTSAKVCCSLDLASVEASIIPIIFQSKLVIGLAKQDSFSRSVKKCSLPETIVGFCISTANPKPFVPQIFSAQIDPGITDFPTSV